jgi:hypothetical protein
MRRSSSIAVAAVALASGCAHGGGRIGGFELGVAVVDVLVSGTVERDCEPGTGECMSGDDRRAAEADADDRERENAAIRATGDRLERERIAATPVHLDRAMVARGLAEVAPRVMSCGDRSEARGRLVVAMQVAADGHVSSVEVRDAPDPVLRDCVATTVQTATFARTRAGGSFRAPLVF